MQSVGRGLRKLAGKEFVNIFDFIDDFRVDRKLKKYENYIWKHGKERLDYYKQYYEKAKNSEVEIIKVNLSYIQKEKSLF